MRLIGSPLLLFEVPLAHSLQVLLQGVTDQRGPVDLLTLCCEIGIFQELRVEHYLNCLHFMWISLHIVLNSRPQTTFGLLVYFLAVAVISMCAAASPNLLMPTVVRVGRGALKAPV